MPDLHIGNDRGSSRRPHLLVPIAQKGQEQAKA
jgi:hypothetical protein